jgi:predicted transcriptional regulator
MEHETRITIRLPDEVAEALRQLAHDHNRSLNGEIVWALRQFIAQQNDQTNQQQKD